MIRLHVIAEGQTEEEFVNSVLSLHLGAFDISTDVRCVETSRRRANPRLGQTARIYRNKIDDLTQICSRFASPELINDGVDSAPSKRIINSIPDYSGSKVSAGPLIAKRIGLPTIREKCPHFSDWVDKLEKLSTHQVQP